MELTQEQADKANMLYGEATKTMNGLIMLEGYRPSEISEDDKARAFKAIELFRELLDIVPEHFPSLFFIGKLYQRLKKYEESLLAFETALKYEYENYNLPQEASLVAMHLNRIDKAIEYSAEAVKRSPNNVVLMGNHAMNLMIAGKDEDAKILIDEVMKIDGNDSININIRNLITDVVNKKRTRPTFAELMG